MPPAAKHWGVAQHCERVYRSLNEQSIQKLKHDIQAGLESIVVDRLMKLDDTVKVLLGDLLAIHTPRFHPSPVLLKWQTDLDYV